MAAPLTFSIDLINGNYTLLSNQNQNFISVKDVPVDTNNDGYLQTVLKINLNDPNLNNPYDKVEFEITYDQDPGGTFSVNIGDSATNNGYGGDAGTQSNDAELQIGATGAISVYGNDYSSSSKLDINSFVSGPSTVNLTVEDEYLGWDNNNGVAGGLNLPFLYALDGQTDDEGSENYDIFAAFNRVISSNSRLGSGVSGVTVTLIDSDHVDSNNQRSFAPDQVIIKLKDTEDIETPLPDIQLEEISEFNFSAEETIESPNNDSLEELDEETIEDLNNDLLEELGAEVIRTTQTLDIQLWDISGSGLSVEEVTEIYSNDPRVEFIEPNYTDAELFLTPNDPDFSNLWALNNTGQTGGTNNADIDAPEGWSFFSYTGGDAVVGILDTGVDYTHPDLNDNIWINPGEIAGNGIDDDNNGYVDDVRGWDFVNWDNDPMDGHGHGTHVAGTIGAEGNNGLGVVGVNWDVEIMPLKIFSDGGGGATYFGIIQALDYATMMGADLTNNSWGTPPLPPGTAPNQGLVTAIANGPLFVAAAGNSANDNDVNPVYPASINLDNIISVAATDHNDQLSGFSNYGDTSVDLGAPGSSIYSTMPNNSYGYMSGTSMAAPHVSGAAALMIATRRHRGLNDLTTLDLRQRVLNAIDPFITSGDTATAGRLDLNSGINQEGIAWGDVHFVTFDGRKYDLQSFGEFILAETARVDDDWVVQTRQEPWVNNNSVSVNTAFATLVDGQTVVFDQDFNNRLQIDGNNVTLVDGDTLSIGNSQIERRGNAYTITYAGDDGIIDSADAQLIARDRSNHINIEISHFGRMQGLLGNNDGNPNNDFALRDGTQLSSNLTVAEIHGDYADSWRVSEDESLFGEPDVLTGNPERFISLEDLDQEEVEVARERALEAGITDEQIIDAVAFDLVATGDESFLEGAAEIFVPTDDVPILFGSDANALVDEVLVTNSTI